MASRCTGYKNAAYCSQYEYLQDRLPVTSVPSRYAAYNETFVDDEGGEPVDDPSYFSHHHNDYLPQDVLCYNRSNDRRLEEFSTFGGGYGRLAPVGQAAVRVQTEGPVRRVGRERSRSVPSRRNTVILAPMVSQAAATLRRSQSTVLRGHQSRQDTVHRSPQQQQPQHHRRSSSVSARQNLFGTPPPRLVRQNTFTATPTRLASFDHLLKPPFDTLETSLTQRTMPNIRRPNTAIITPNYRPPHVTEPLLPPTPSKNHPPRSPSNTSWVQLPTQRLPTTTLCLVGMIQLLSGGMSCILCFYLLSLRGRSYYLDLATISSFVCLMLGLLGCRSSRWLWLPHRNYLSGYMVVCAFSLLNCLALALLASTDQRSGSPMVDVSAGAVSALSVLLITLCLLGAVSSTCCKSPPPDNRVSHCAEGFTV